MLILDFVCALMFRMYHLDHIKASMLDAKIPICHSEIQTLDLPILCLILYSFATKHSIFATNIDALMWPMVRMKHERAHKIQKIRYCSIFWHFHFW